MKEWNNILATVGIQKISELNKYSTLENSRMEKFVNLFSEGHLKVMYPTLLGSFNIESEEGMELRKSFESLVAYTPRR